MRIEVLDTSPSEEPTEHHLFIHQVLAESILYYKYYFGDICEQKAQSP